MKLAVVPRTEILVENRVRKDLGNVEALATSMKDKEIIQPLAVVALDPPQGDFKYRLIAGGRRFAASELVGITELPIRIFDQQLSPLELKELELEENYQRKDLTWQEQVQIKDEIHSLKVQIHGTKSTSGSGWGTRDTAQLLGETHTTVAADINLASELRKDPDKFKGVEKKSEAYKVVAAEKERQIKQELAKRAIKSGKLDSVKNYIVGDFFKLVSEIPDSSIDFVELDPPWGVEYDRQIGATGGELPAFKDIKHSEYEEFLTKVLKECYRVLKNDSWLIIWYSKRYHEESTVKLLKQHKLVPYPIPAIWVKPGVQGRPLQGDRGLTSTYEPFIYAAKGDSRVVKIRPNTFFHTPPGSTERRHPTEKPVDLMSEILTTFCFPNSKVLCPFLGSGNILFAAEELHMQAFGYELEKEYLDSFVLAASQRKKAEVL